MSCAPHADGTARGDRLPRPAPIALGSGSSLHHRGRSGGDGAWSRAAHQDLDIVYQRDTENLTRLATALAPLAPYLRGAPPDLPFVLDAETLRRGLNFTLTSKLGDVDLLGEIVGGGGHDDLLPDSIEIELFGIRCRCLGLRKLIEVKRAAGRPKDFEAIAELEALLERSE